MATTVHLPLFVTPPLTETPGEIKPLEAVLESKWDINVKVGQWRWSEANPWPPVHNVKAVPLWSDPKYDVLRERMQRPAPAPTVTVGGEFITINVRAAAKALIKKQKDKEKGGKVGGRTPKKAPTAASAAEDDEPSQVLIPKSSEVFPFSKSLQLLLRLERSYGHFTSPGLEQSWPRLLFFCFDPCRLRRRQPRRMPSQTRRASGLVDWSMPSP